MGERAGRAHARPGARCRQGPRRADATARATEFLRDVLAEDRLDVLTIEQQARAAGLLIAGQCLRFSKPFRDARSSVGVVVMRSGFGCGARFVLEPVAHADDGPSRKGTYGGKDTCGVDCNTRP